MTKDQIHDMLIACQSDNPVIRATALRAFANFLLGMQNRIFTQKNGVVIDEGHKEYDL